jgi:hypothetical protein
MLDSAGATAATDTLPSRRTILRRVARIMGDIARTVTVFYSRPAIAFADRQGPRLDAPLVDGDKAPPWHYSTGFLIIGMDGGPRIIASPENSERNGIAVSDGDAIEFDAKLTLDHQ